MSKKESYKLTYFNKRGGGEIIRLVFVAANVEYEDNRLEMAEWLEIKKDSPMRSLPNLQVTKDGKEIIYCQSGAIAKYLARKYGLYSETPEGNFHIEEMYDSVGDVRGVFMQYHYCDKKEQAKHLEKLKTETIPKFADFFDLRRREFGMKDKFIIGEKLTLADLAVFNMVDSCTEMGLGSLWQPYPNLVKHREMVMKINQIEQWLKRRPKTDV